LLLDLSGAREGTALLEGLVDLDVLDDPVAGVKTLGVGVGLGVRSETRNSALLRGLIVLLERVEVLQVVGC
jgi:hypothetical protein